MSWLSRSCHTFRSITNSTAPTCRIPRLGSRKHGSLGGIGIRHCAKQVLWVCGLPKSYSSLPGMVSVMLHSIRALRSCGVNNVKTPPNRASRTSDEASLHTSHLRGQRSTDTSQYVAAANLRIEERTALSVDDGCYIWRYAKIVGIVPRWRS